jgi:hypothetical protein
VTALPAVTLEGVAWTVRELRLWEEGFEHPAVSSNQLHSSPADIVCEIPRRICGPNHCEIPKRIEGKQIVLLQAQDWSVAS